MMLVLLAFVLLGLATLFGAMAALLLVPADLIAEACRPGDPPVHRARLAAEHRAPFRAPPERRAA